MAKRRFNFVLSRKPPPAARQITEVRQEIRARLNEVGKAHVASRRQVVANWSSTTKPRFSYKVGVNVGRITLQVNVQEKALPFWRFVDRGTRRHVIKAKNPSGRLRFRTGGFAKTQPNPPRFGSGRRPNGPWRAPEQVNHPGTKARHFSRKINKDLKKDELAAIRNGGRAGLRKANK